MKKKMFKKGTEIRPNQIQSSTFIQISFMTCSGVDLDRSFTCSYYYV